MILNNNNLGMIEYEQQVKGNINYGIELEDIDFAKFAEACGGKGISVSSHEELAPAFDTALQSDKPVIIDVAVTNEPPLPGKITYTQAAGFSKYLLKNSLKKASWISLHSRKV